MGLNGNAMPVLLRAAMVLGAVLGILGTVVGLWALLRVLAGDGSFQFDELPISDAELLTAVVLFLVVYISACLTAGAASWALWKRQARSRSLLTLLLAEFVVGDAAMLTLMYRTPAVTASDLAVSALFFTAIAALWLWYLFRKDSVVRYYQSLRPPGV